MSQLFEATKKLILSIRDVEYLVSRANQEKNASNQKNRMLYIKLSVVSLVSKFQVFFENILEEYLYELKIKKTLLSRVSPHIRLVSARLNTEHKRIIKKLENPTQYNSALLNDLNSCIKIILDHFDDQKPVSQDFEICIKFPLGKAGSNELIQLLKQIDGSDPFDGKIDITKLDSILNIRHNIIHQDSNPQITEAQVLEYIRYIKKLAYYTNNYLYLHCDKSG